MCVCVLVLSTIYLPEVHMANRSKDKYLREKWCLSHLTEAGTKGLGVGMGWFHRDSPGYMYNTSAGQVTVILLLTTVRPSIPILLDLSAAFVTINYYYNLCIFLLLLFTGLVLIFLTLLNMITLVAHTLTLTLFGTKFSSVQYLVLSVLLSISYLSPYFLRV